jgi:hypothetical protein
MMRFEASEFRNTFQYLCMVHFPNAVIKAGTILSMFINLPEFLMSSYNSSLILTLNFESFHGHKLKILIHVLKIRERCKVPTLFDFEVPEDHRVLHMPLLIPVWADVSG